MKQPFHGAPQHQMQCIDPQSLTAPSLFARYSARGPFVSCHCDKSCWDFSKFALHSSLNFMNKSPKVCVALRRCLPIQINRLHCVIRRGHAHAQCNLTCKQNSSCFNVWYTFTGLNRSSGAQGLRIEWVDRVQFHLCHGTPAMKNSRHCGAGNLLCTFQKNKLPKNLKFDFELVICW